MFIDVYKNIYIYIQTSQAPQEFQQCLNKMCPENLLFIRGGSYIPAKPRSRLVLFDCMHLKHDSLGIEICNAT